MATIAAPATGRPRAARSVLSPVATLARRRSQLTVRTPRELFVPLLTPILFALVIAPALKQALHTSAAYESFIAVGTIGLLVPLNTMFAGLSVIVDREAGAQRELLAATGPSPHARAGQPRRRLRGDGVPDHRPHRGRRGARDPLRCHGQRDRVVPR